jgi:hypothetical protein
MSVFYFLVDMLSMFPLTIILIYTGTVDDRFILRPMSRNEQEKKYALFPGMWSNSRAIAYRGLP